MAEVTILGVGPDPVVRDWEIGANLYHALAEERHRFMEDFVRQFVREWGDA